MAKTIKGSELIKALEEGKLKAGQQIRFTSTIAPEVKIAIVITKEDGLYLQDTDTKNVINTGWLINSKIEILEEQQDIDIQEIEEMDKEWTYVEGLVEKTWSVAELEIIENLNKLASAVKQLDRNIKDKE